MQAEIAYTEKSQRWRMPNNHFAVPNLPDWLHLYGLDTTVIFDRGRERNAGKRAQLAESERQQLEAAKKALCGKSGWRLLFGHHPIYSSGIHGQEGGNPGVMPALKQALLPGVIEPCAVQVYFAGHDHDQEHLKAKAFDQVVQGAGGKDLRRIGNLSDQEKKQVFGKSIPGFALVQVTRKQLQMDFYDASACKPMHHWEKTLTEP